MYVICVYDVEAKRCTKIMKCLRQYLFHIQNSVFEGTLTPKQFYELETKLSGLIEGEDSVIFYFSYNDKDVNKIIKGKQQMPINIIISSTNSERNR